MRVNEMSEATKDYSKFDTIPRGLYCYEIKSIEKREGDFPLIKTRYCDHFEFVSDDPAESGYCHLFKCSVMDCCKECGFKMGR